MPVIDVRDSEFARQYLLQGLWIQTIGTIDEKSMVLGLTWAAELADADEPIPPLGFVVDVGLLIHESVQSVTRRMSDAIHGFPEDLVRQYEDYVLGKLYADSSFERGGTAISRYMGRDKDRGTAWLIARFRERADCGGIRCSPNLLRTLRNESPDDLLLDASKSISTDGFVDCIEEHYRELISGTRTLGEVLSVADVFELENETALAEFGQRLALRQTLEASAVVGANIAEMQPRSSGRDRDIKTNINREDAYPVGGFTSISTRGSIESLLNSQLAYMDPKPQVVDPDQEPDLFDIKFIRNELLYYSRDENEFLRRRRTYLIAFYPDLIRCRVKTGQLAWQQIVMIFATVYQIVKCLTQWLGDESLSFHIVFVTSQESTPLEEEAELAEMLFREQIAKDLLQVSQRSYQEIREMVSELAQKSLVHCITISKQDRSWDAKGHLLTRLEIGAGGPAVHWDDRFAVTANHDLANWQDVCAKTLEAIM